MARFFLQPSATQGSRRAVHFRGLMFGSAQTGLGALSTLHSPALLEDRMAQRASPPEAPRSTWVQHELDPLLAEVIETLRRREAQAAAKNPLLPVTAAAVESDRRVDTAIAEVIKTRYANLNRRRQHP